MKKLRKHLKIQSVPLYKETNNYISLINEIRLEHNDPSFFKSEEINRYRGQICRELDVRISNITFCYENEALFRYSDIKIQFQYNYNRYSLTVTKGVLLLFDKYKYHFTSESAPDAVDRSLGGMLVICMMVELLSALKYIYPNKYRGVKLNEII